MNVFVLGTGRCGTLTFTKACEHITNYTAGHESLRRYLGEPRVMYPPDHIEADCRLAWRLGTLEAKYGRDAFYVHLTRERSLVQRSYERKFFRKRQGQAMGWGYMVAKASFDEMMPCVITDMLETMTANIEAFLKDKAWMHIEIENAPVGFSRFLGRIGAQGDLDAALSEFDVRHGAFDRPAVMPMESLAR